MSNFAFCDGSVHPITLGIPQTVLSQLASRDGEGHADGRLRPLTSSRPVVARPGRRSSSLPTTGGVDLLTAAKLLFRLGLASPACSCPPSGAGRGWPRCYRPRGIPRTGRRRTSARSVVFNPLDLEKNPFAGQGLIKPDGTFRLGTMPKPDEGIPAPARPLGLHQSRPAIRASTRTPRRRSSRWWTGRTISPSR